jgi:3'-phosphoadenosine 5'-phosphosulfate sulfotransferase (PAPS reductase)/FAD synthetase
MVDLDTKISDAMHRIEDLYYSTNGKCYLSFSGGKDSTVILAIIKMCEEIYTIPKNGIPAVYCDTGIELAATKQFVNWVKDNWYGNVQIIRPEKSFYHITKEYGKPMKSKMKSEYLARYQRGKSEAAKQFSFKQLMAIDDTKDNPSQYYKSTKLANKDLHLMHPDFDIQVSNKCCDILKKKPFEKYGAENDIAGYILGERMSEGGARYISAKKRLAETGKLCTKTKGKHIVKLPIIDWTDEDIEAFIEKYNVPLSKAYTEYGLERTGCFLCPFSLQLKDNLKNLNEFEPLQYKASMAFLKDVFIAQNVELSFDQEYEKERLLAWETKYHKMRFEMLDKYRQDCGLYRKYKKQQENN